MSEGRRIIKEQNENGDCLGEVTIERNKKSIGTFLRNLFVGEEHRGHGIGSKLLDRAIEQAGGPISLEVEKTNLTAVKLYLKNNFRITEEITARDGRIYLRMRRD